MGANESISAAEESDENSVDTSEEINEHNIFNLDHLISLRSSYQRKKREEDEQGGDMNNYVSFITLYFITFYNQTKMKSL